MGEILDKKMIHIQSWVKEDTTNFYHATQNDAQFCIYE